MQALKTLRVFGSLARNQNALSLLTQRCFLLLIPYLNG